MRKEFLVGLAVVLPPAILAVILFGVWLHVVVTFLNLFVVTIALAMAFAVIGLAYFFTCAVGSMALAIWGAWR